MATRGARAAMVAAAVATLTSGRAMASPGDMAPLVLHVTDYAHLKTGELDLKPGDLLEAKRLATAVYARIGVRVVWADGCAAGAAPDGALHLDVILLSAEMTARRQPAPAPMTFGQASRETRRAFIYSARVINHAIQTGSDPSWVLALVLAHEVGHMLLPVYSHTTSGLMRPYWEGRIAAIPDFLPSQAEEIRSRLAAQAPPDDAGETSASSLRVRSSDPALVALIDQATHRSKTFRQLVQTIEATNGIVYVDPGKCSHGVHACLPMSMQVSGPNRLMHIVIDRTTRASDIETMTSLGHELQHAIEVLGDPTVHDGLTMFNFYRRTATTDSNRFETTAAVNAGNTVFDELRASARNPR